MYEQKFNLSQQPFSVCPQPEEYFPGQSHQQAIAASRSCVERRNGPATIIGAVGTGKSLTLQVIGDVCADQFDVVAIECSRLEQRSELLQSILFGMGLPFREMSEGELRLSLLDHLKNGSGNPNGILLLVDEADRLSIELLDELRLITNVVREGLSQAQLVLAGTQRLEESLNDPRLASFGQRIASRSYLQNFSCEEVRDYIAQQIDRAGGNAGDIFEADAVDEVARNSDGCPRVVNQLCERSLAVAAEQDRAKVTPDIVQIAWAELQNLPVPNSAFSTDVHARCPNKVSADSVVEFGSLDDEQLGEEPQQRDAKFQEGDDVRQEEDSDSPSNNEEVQEQSGGELQENNDSAVAATWSGQLPTNLGITDSLVSGAGAAGVTAVAFGSGDPFAPQQELPPTAQYQFGPETGLESYPAEDISSRPSDSQSADGDAGESINAGLDYETIGNPNQLLGHEQEQQEQARVGDSEEVVAQTDPVDQQVVQGEELVEHAGGDAPQNDVQTAFDGLGLIDKARSGEGVPTTQQPAVEPSVDPFAEDFEEEVSLQDAYSPFVAQQNKSSLSVTSEQLSHLYPNDEVAAAETQDNPAPVEDEAVAWELNSGFEMPQVESTTPYIPVSSVSTELNPQTLESQDAAPLQESVQSQEAVPPQDALSSEETVAPQDAIQSQTSGPQASVEPAGAVEAQDSIEEIDPDLAALTSDFSFEEETSDSAAGEEVTTDEGAPLAQAEMEDGIRGMAFDMTQDVRSAIDSDSSQTGYGPSSQQPVGANGPGSIYGENNVSEAISAGEPQAVQYSQQPPLDQSQQVLREILAQQKIVNQTQFQQPQFQQPEFQQPQFQQPQSGGEGVDSVSVEYPISDHVNYQAPSEPSNDDRDMLRVNEMHYTQTPQREPEQNPYADADPSTGEAERMDYGKLFDRLRNLPKE